MGQVLPALLHLLGATTHDGCRIAALAALKTMAASPGTSDFRYKASLGADSRTLSSGATVSNPDAHF